MDEATRDGKLREILADAWNEHFPAGGTSFIKSGNHDWDSGKTIPIAVALTAMKRIQSGVPVSEPTEEKTCDHPEPNRVITGDGIFCNICGYSQLFGQAVRLSETAPLSVPGGGEGWKLASDALDKAALEIRQTDFDALGRDVTWAGGAGGNFQFDESYFKGHQRPGINFNSLARIIDRNIQRVVESVKSTLRTPPNPLVENKGGKRWTDAELREVALRAMTKHPFRFGLDDAFSLTAVLTALREVSGPQDAPDQSDGGK